MRLEGATAIVTGGGTGVGAASALRLARKGANVIINYSNSSEAANAVAENCRKQGVEAITIQGDVSLDSQCRRIVDTAMDAWGRVDALVNSAATIRAIPHSDLDAVTPDVFEAIFAVNLRGPFQMMRAVAPHMRARGEGAIVNISSVSGIIGDGSSIPYACSKGALNTLTKSMARVLAPHIRVNAVCPDYITGRWLRDRVSEDVYSITMQNARERSALDKVSGPDDIAETVVWFIEGAGFITGENLVIDAGIHLAV